VNSSRCTGRSGATSASGSSPALADADDDRVPAGRLSIAEETLTAWRKKELSPSVHVDHREAKGPIRIRDAEHTMKQLRYVYGAASEWMDLDRIYREMLDPRSCPDDATAARYFLNRPMSTVDAWIAKDVAERQVRRGDVVAAGEAITLGFDGSLNDDTTVLRGCRMSDGFRFRIGAWPKPEGRPASAGKCPAPMCWRRSVRRSAATTWSAPTSTRTSGARTSTTWLPSSASGWWRGRRPATRRWAPRWTGCTPT
jgi:hypothetical protein